MKKILCFFFAIFLLFASFSSVNVWAEENDASKKLKCEACLADNDNITGFSLTKDGNSSLFARMLATAIESGNGGCWFCPLFKTAFNTINTVTTRLYNGMQDIFVMLLALGGGLWVIWIVFQFIIVLHGANVGEFMTNMFKALGKLMIAAWLLYSPASFLFGIVVDPVVLIGTNLSREILSASGMNPMKSFTIDYNCPCDEDRLKEAGSHPEVYLCGPVSSDDDMFYDFEYDNNGKKVKDAAGDVKKTRKALSPEIYNSFTCYLKTVSLTLITGMIAGQAIMYWGFHTWDGILPFNLPGLIIGLIITIAYFLYFLFVPLKFIDLLVRLGFVFIMLPFFVVCWAFPVTKQYAKKGWDMMISCLFTLLCLTVFIIIGLNLVEGVLYK